MEERWGKASKFTLSSSSWFVVIVSSFKALDINNYINDTEKIYLPSLKCKLGEKNYLEIYYDNYVEIWFPLIWHFSLYKSKDFNIFACYNTNGGFYYEQLFGWSKKNYGC